MELLLGSNSPRRNELMTQMGFSFKKVKIDCEETFSTDMQVNKVAQYLAEKKACAYGDLEPNQILITADTTVVHNNTILNKPANKEEAYDMLSQLNNNNHDVVTGVCIRTNSGLESFSCTTNVEVDLISERDLNYYINEYKPYDKAGGYGIQEWFGLTQIKGIRGCYFNVVGLPCNDLFKRLKNDYGI